MPAAHRRGDLGSGHGCHFPPSPATGGSENVFVNGRPLMRVGDSYAPHACVAGHAGPHGRALAEGSRSVFVNGRKAGRLGDAIDCGGTAASASSNVFIGDAGPTGGRAVCQKAMARSSTPFVKG
ncbi:PAAR domain-containing protein [Jiella sp. MQZ9-1]|uniref:PAAR domain-containing protein n=1 Tax=Jiella flava TaxID=2816857 RepID=A0A939JXE1_9HYPH|nr:PAAR domain-containing protein [Jiella flava]MBO0664504.1 PAAR domain-containing protein [Jiella flava]MCD2473140.1 PAAR domain-containing protein [Jiella flava]